MADERTEKQKVQELTVVTSKPKMSYFQQKGTLCKKISLHRVPLSIYQVANLGNIMDDNIFQRIITNL